MDKQTNGEGVRVVKSRVEVVDREACEYDVCSLRGGRGVLGLGDEWCRWLGPWSGPLQGETALYK